MVYFKYIEKIVIYLPWEFVIAVLFICIIYLEIQLYLGDEINFSSPVFYLEFKYTYSKRKMVIHTGEIVV